MEGPHAEVAAAGDVRVLALVLRRLLHGQPVHSSALSAELGLAPADLDAALGRLDAAGAVYLADGLVAAAYPLSAVPTRYRVRIGESTAYANCAVDALAVPFMVDDPLRIESDCADCGEAITIAVQGDRILAATPTAPVLFHVSRDCCEAGPAVLTRCPHINFFCDAAHAHRWLAAHPERSGDILTLGQAVAQARESFAAVIRVSRGEEVSPARLSRNTATRQ